MIILLVIYIIMVILCSYVNKQGARKKIPIRKKDDKRILDRDCLLLYKDYHVCIYDKMGFTSRMQSD